MQRSSVFSTLVRRPLSGRWGAVWLVVLLVGLAGIVAYGPGLKRRALWAAINACEVAERWTGSAWPCLFVSQTPGGRDIVVLNAPLEPGHVLVVPSERIDGIESPELAGRSGSDYLAAAWRLREQATAHIAGKPGWADFGLAINGPWNRTQKQLHIHVECLTREAAQAFAALRGIPAGPWVALEGYRRTFARRWASDDLSGLDFRRDLYDAVPLPPDIDAGRINLGAAGIVGPSGQNEFVLLYTTGRTL